MYIGSPINHEDENFDHDYEDNNKVHYYQGIHQTQVDAGIESDDSMASDASSGPSQHAVNFQPLGIYEGGYDDLRHLKKNVEEGEYVNDKVYEYYCLDHQKKGDRKKENQVGEKNGEKKQKTQVQGGGKVKVRKNQRVGGTRK